jgi:hypothetical protein
MQRRVRLTFSIVCLILSIIYAWLLLDSFRNPMAVSYTSRDTETTFTILSGCCEYGHPVTDRRTYLNPPYRLESQGWHHWHVLDGVGELQLDSFFPGFIHGNFFISSFGPGYYGSILAGYWVFVLLLLPATPLLWRLRRTIVMVVLPAVICCGTFFLWVRSSHTTDIFYIDLSHWSGNISCGEGAMELNFSYEFSTNNRPYINWETNNSPRPIPQLSFPVWSQHGTVTIPGSFAVTTHEAKGLFITDWLAAVLVSVCTLPILGFECRRSHRGQRSNRRSAGKICHKCGYDLRASIARCPECGEIIRKTKQ